MDFNDIGPLWILMALTKAFRYSIIKRKISHGNRCLWIPPYCQNFYRYAC